MKLLWKRTLQVHILLWVVLAIVSYATAGIYAFVSCWPFILIIPPLGFVFIFLFLCSLVTLIRWIFYPQFRTRRSFIIESHIMIIIFGAVICRVVANIAIGQVSCL